MRYRLLRQRDQVRRRIAIRTDRLQARAGLSPSVRRARASSPRACGRERDQSHRSCLIGAPALETGPVESPSLREEKRQALASGCRAKALHAAASGELIVVRRISLDEARLPAVSRCLGASRQRSRADCRRSAMRLIVRSGRRGGRVRRRCAGSRRAVQSSGRETGQVERNIRHPRLGGPREGMRVGGRQRRRARLWPGGSTAARKRQELVDRRQMVY